MHTDATHSYTEIYTGGGDFITQSAPTYFHQFFTRKILTSQESIDDYREVTAAQKAAIEAADAQWVRPPQQFIDAWNAAADPQPPGYHTKYGRYNEATGYFELNGLTDITYEQALAIYRSTAQGNWFDCCYWGHYIRTNFAPPANSAIYGTGWDEGTAPKSVFRRSSIEVARLGVKPDFIHYGSLSGFFRDCPNLKEVIGRLGDSGSVRPIKLTGCRALEKIWITRLRVNLEAPDSPLLSLESIEFAVDNSEASNPISITLHPDAFARLTDTLISKAAAKNIDFTTI